MKLRSFLLTNMVVVCCLMHMKMALPVTAYAGAGAAPLRNETDHLALIAFKGAIREDPYGALASWNKSLHFCDWVGISCSQLHKQRVVSLNLDSQKLRGVLSPHIGNLSFLKILNLSNNAFTGQLPNDVSRLFRLRVLNLENNTFEGEIPVNLSSCVDIRYLNFRSNKLEGQIPFQLGSLEKIEVLRLDKNNLTGSIPSSLGNLSYLENLGLRDNQLVGTIPPDLARLHKLRLFEVGYNHLSGTIPPQLYNLSEMETFSVSGNRYLQGILPWDIGLTLPNLDWLAVGGNKFTGSFPLSLLNCSKLTYLDLVDNMFSGPIPHDLGRLYRLSRLVGGVNKFGTAQGSQTNDLQFLSSLTNCTNLQVVSMWNNALRGSIPVSTANLSSQLLFLDLGVNNIYGPIPSEIGSLVSLNRLSLWKNSISGRIPDTLGKLQGLQSLFLDGNELTGPIPSSLGNLTQLSRLYLSDNKLDGSIPSNLSNSLNLIDLELFSNNLTGAIPVQLFNLRDLSVGLLLSHNSLTGPLPIEVGRLSNLGVLDVSHNKLSGGIPATLGDCLSLRILLMQGNMFEESIPESFSALKGIEKLNLSRNKLTGTIPTFLGDLPFLQFLDLSFNDLEGAVPGGGKFGNASVLNVDGNLKLCGGISQLKLPLCQTLEKKNFSNRSLALKVIAPTIVGGIFLAVLAYFVIMGWKKRTSITYPSSPSSSMKFRHFRISYAELVKATNSFSETNLLGVGTYSSVYKGILDRDGMIVAIKVLNLRQRGGYKSFASECNILKGVRHRNLVKILTSCSSVDFQGNDFKAIVFEFMSHGSLEKWLHPGAVEQHVQRNFGLIERLNIAIDVASALDHLHHQSQPKIVHCDLKPSNVLLDSEMTAHVGDFGLAKILSSVSDDSRQSLTNSFAIKGSIGYVAPEYAQGNEVSTEGDTYSFGILLMEMFTGKRPTDDLFKDGLSLRSFTNMALPDRVVEIIDPRLLVEEGTGDRMQECLAEVLKVGVACSTESSKDRIHMGEVVLKLTSIRNVYLGGGVLGEKNRSRNTTTS